MSANPEQLVAVPKILPQTKVGTKQESPKEGEYYSLRFRSTGLGKTMIEGEPLGVKIVDDTIVLQIQSTTPVRWQIRAAMSYRGLLQCIKLALKPPVLKFIFFGWCSLKKPRLPEEF